MKLHRNEMKSWFFNRGYPKALIDTDFSKVKFLNSSWDKRTKGHEIPLVITYHPLLKSFSKFINKQVKKTFTPGPMVSFWGTQKVIGYLVRLKLYPQQRYVGSFKCKGKRQVCMNVTESNTFSNATDKKEYTINHNFNYSGKYIIDLLTCYNCQMQYVGKTVDEFCLQWNKYKDNNKKYLKKEACMQQHLFEDF